MGAQNKCLISNTGPEWPVLFSISSLLTVRPGGRACNTGWLGWRGAGPARLQAPVGRWRVARGLSDNCRIAWWWIITNGLSAATVCHLLPAAATWLSAESAARGASSSRGNGKGGVSCRELLATSSSALSEQLSQAERGVLGVCVGRSGVGWYERVGDRGKGRD